MMEKRLVELMCALEIKWRESKARSNGGIFNLFYHGVDGRSHGIGAILKEGYKVYVGDAT